MGIVTSVFSEAELYHHWAKEQRMTLNGVSYRVGKMSYGQYFLEPGIALGERAPFNTGTLWLSLIDDEDFKPSDRMYKIEED